MFNSILWSVRQVPTNSRYIIVNVVTGHTLDDAQGYGFRDFDKAYNYARNKYKCEAFVDEKPKSNTLF
jgi:flavin reductase (DIM6/NTAB) family NADH-FMN oxidoreductase RutF